MPHNTPRLIVLAGLTAGILVFATVVDYVIHHPGWVLSLVLLVYVFSRPHLPLAYLVDELDRHFNRVAVTVAQWIPLIYIVLLGVGTWRYWGEGPMFAFARSMLFLYVVDRLFAFATRRTVAAWQIHQMRRARRERDGDLVDGEAVR